MTHIYSLQDANCWEPTKPWQNDRRANQQLTFAFQLSGTIPRHVTEEFGNVLFTDFEKKNTKIRIKVGTSPPT